MHGPANDALSRLVPDVLEFSTPQFELKTDLKHLIGVLQIEANEAVVFYSSRILDALTSEAMRRLGQEANGNVFANLEMLWYWNRFGVATRSWAHALRRLGNMVRHIWGRIGPTEASLAVLFAERWLSWYFSEFSHGHRLTRVTRDGITSVFSTGDNVRDWMYSILQVDSLSDRLTPLLSPIMPAVTAELLLSRKQDDAAFLVLKNALEAFPDDLRLGQLMGLFWSRRQELDKALAFLEPVRRRNPDDEETVGILAGVYKRQWLADESKSQALRESHRLYQSGWKRSTKTNTYLGINSAATALWMGNRDLATQTAREVEQVLRKRTQALPPDLRDTDESFDYWDSVTLAETRLIQNDRHTAEQLYEAAFAKHAELQGDIEVSRRQRERIERA